MIKKKSKNTKLDIKSWYSNRYQIVVVQRNILLMLTGLSIISVAVAVFFVRAIIASKSLDPYVIELEEKTGIATVVQRDTAQNYTSEQAVRRYFINMYINGAAGYDPRTYIKDVTAIRLFSSAKVYSEFRRRINPRELGPGAKISIRIKSIQFIDGNTAQIRILKQTELNKDQPPELINEVVTMKFSFIPELQLTMEERMINPLGFQVQEFLIAEEVFKY